MPVAKNYIHRLQDENTEKQERIEDIERQLREFQIHISSSKFTGTDPDGGRRDWIATGDVNTRLMEILSTL
jgi:cell division septum initiation protein DivIVA